EHALAAFLVSRVVTQNPRPRGPRVPSLITGGRRLRVDVELPDARRTLPVRHTEAVGRGVPATNDHHMLTRSIHRRLAYQAGHKPVGAHEVLHREVDPLEVPPRHVG